MLSLYCQVLLYSYTFTGEFSPGAVELQFGYGAFKDSNGNSEVFNVAFDVTGATADLYSPFNGSTNSVLTLNDNKYIDVLFNKPDGLELDINSILDADYYRC